MSFNIRKLSRKQTRACATSEKSQSFVDDDDDFEDFSFSLKRNVRSASTISASTQPPATLQKSKSEAAFQCKSISEKVDTKLQQKARVVLEKLENSPHRSMVKHCFRCHQSVNVELHEHETECPAGARTRTHMQIKRMLVSSVDNDTSPEIAVPCVNVKLNNTAVDNDGVENFADPICNGAVSDCSNKTGAVLDGCQMANHTQSEADSVCSVDSNRTCSKVIKNDKNEKLDATNPLVFEIENECGEKSAQSRKSECDPGSQVGSNQRRAVPKDGVKTAKADCNSDESGSRSGSKSKAVSVDIKDDVVIVEKDSVNTQVEGEGFELRVTPEPKPASCEDLRETVQSSDSEDDIIINPRSGASYYTEPETSSIYDKLPCPICCKTGPRGLARLKHIRSCAAKQGMNLGEMNAAIQLQKKQAEERLAAGLPIVAKPVEPRRPTARRQKQPMVGLDPDLDVALAISASMHEAELENEKLLEENMMIEAGLGDAVLALREEPSTSKAKKVKSTGSKLVMTGGGSKSGTQNRLLLTLTKEQRENRTSERVAEILGKSLEVTKPPSRGRSCMSLTNLEGLLVNQDKIKQLWNLSMEDNGQGSNGVDTKEDFYIEEIRKLLSPKKSGKSSKKTLDIPGRMMTQHDVSVSEQATVDILVDLQDSPSSSSEVNSPHSSSRNPSPDKKPHDRTPSETPPNMTPSERLSYDFAKLLDKKEFSDSVAVLADNAEICVHNLVLKIRAPKLVEVLMRDSKLDLRFITKRGGLALLNYIYSAKIPENLGLTTGDESQLNLLALRYDLPELTDVLKVMKMKETDDFVCYVATRRDGDRTPTKSGTPKNKKVVPKSTKKASRKDSVSSSDILTIVQEPERTKISSERVVNGVDQPSKNWGWGSGSCEAPGGSKRPPTPDLFDDVTIKRSKSDLILREFSPIGRYSKTQYLHTRRSEDRTSSISESIDRISEAQHISNEVNMDIQSLRKKSLSVSSSQPSLSLLWDHGNKLEEVRKKGREMEPEEVIDLATPEELRGCDAVDGGNGKPKSVSRAARSYVVETARKHLFETSHVGVFPSISVSPRKEMFKLPPKAQTLMQCSTAQFKSPVACIASAVVGSVREAGKQASLAQLPKTDVSGKLPAPSPSKSYAVGGRSSSPREVPIGGVTKLSPSISEPFFDDTCRHFQPEPAVVSRPFKTSVNDASELSCKFEADGISKLSDSVGNDGSVLGEKICTRRKPLTSNSPVLDDHEDVEHVCLEPAEPEAYLPPENTSYLEAYDLSDFHSIDLPHLDLPESTASTDLPVPLGLTNLPDGGNGKETGARDKREKVLGHAGSTQFAGRDDAACSTDEEVLFSEHAQTDDNSRSSVEDERTKPTTRKILAHEKSQPNHCEELLPDDSFDDILQLPDFAVSGCNLKEDASVSTAVSATTGNSRRAENQEPSRSLLRSYAVEDVSRLRRSASDSCTVTKAAAGKQKSSQVLLVDDSLDYAAAAIDSPLLKPPATAVTPVQVSRKRKKKKYPPVTPKPQYETMMTPELKIELDRFGLKPLKRKNAVKILNHIYEETHPFVTDSEDEVEVSPIRRCSGAKPSKKHASSTQVPRSNESSSSDERDSEFDEIVSLEEVSGVEDQLFPPSSQATQTVNLPEMLKRFVRDRPTLYTRILRYEPILLNELHAQVKEAGIKCSVAKLMDWLDDQGITFRFPTQRRMKRKTSARSTKDKSDSA